jgi:hypothetical protein
MVTGLVDFDKNGPLKERAGGSESGEERKVRGRGRGLSVREIRSELEVRGFTGSCLKVRKQRSRVRVHVCERERECERW